MVIVNLHFETKEKLLIETLRFISTEYTSGLTEIFNNENLSAEEKIISHVSFDFSRKLPTGTKSRCGLRFGEKPNQHQPIYQFVQVILKK